MQRSDTPVIDTQDHIPAVTEERDPSRLTIALAWISARRARDEVFDVPLFVNPAWDILVDLYVSHCRTERHAVSSVCMASSAPLTTALRWVAVLEGQGLVERAPDPRDKRRIFLSLSGKGVATMERALDATARSDAKLGLGRLRLVK